ncbi:general secretion pathway protein GspB [Vibrio galatheae]|uniref:General secretion pathway protein GspB n=1 Tax=Vibrio galatheae TaxID=579748 RepID=A0A0F4NGC6_9VIBR|nr:general secretion pathway protein GspB [Vibrio galatheae]KJY82165.1 general secretion pathway protein GspB [Vibrio galatheae]
MSKVMQAIERSERSHNTLAGATPKPSYSLAKNRGVSRSAINLAMIAIPPILVMITMTLQTYQTQKQAWLEINVAETVVVEVPFAYQVRATPDFSPLRTTYQDNSSEAKITWLNQVDEDVSQLPPTIGDPEIPNNSQQAVKGDDLLTGLDLSQLSPELAQRFQSALNANTRNEQLKQNQNAVNLAQQADRWYGKLPALNFQTHVYSSKTSKRWVKVNGIEYSQGDWLSDDIELVRIDPRSCLIRFKGELIEVPALYDWQG